MKPRWGKQKVPWKCLTVGGSKKSSTRSKNPKKLLLQPTKKTKKGRKIRRKKVGRTKLPPMSLLCLLLLPAYKASHFYWTNSSTGYPLKRWSQPSWSPLSPKIQVSSGTSENCSKLASNPSLTTPTVSEQIKAGTFPTILKVTNSTSSSFQESWAKVQIL